MHFVYKYHIVQFGLERPWIRATVLKLKEGLITVHLHQHEFSRYASSSG